jgi:hypothetical protein
MKYQRTKLANVTRSTKVARCRSWNQEAEMTINVKQSFSILIYNPRVHATFLTELNHFWKFLRMLDCSCWCKHSMPKELQG